MSIKKPIIEVIIECPLCNGKGKKMKYGVNECKLCNGTGLIDIKPTHQKFGKYYIKDLKESIKYYTALYKIKSRGAKEYLKTAKKYSKELDKVVNK